MTVSMSFLIAIWRLAKESCSVSLVGRTFLWRPQRYLSASFAPIFAKWAPHLSSTCSWCQQHKLFSWRYSSFFCKSQCWPPYLGFVCINPSSSTNEFGFSGTVIFYSWNERSMRPRRQPWTTLCRQESWSSTIWEGWLLSMILMSSKVLNALYFQCCLDNLCVNHSSLI